MIKLLKMEVYELTHDYICLLMIGMNLIFGITQGNGYLEDNYFRLPEGGYQVFLSMLYDSTAISIIISVFTALLMGKSFSNRTILVKIMTGHDRKAVFLSKAVSIVTISTISMLVFPILGALTVTIKCGWNAEIIQSIITLFKIIVCTTLLDFSIFSVIIFWGVIFMDTVRTVTASVITIFFNALYMAYTCSSDLNLPISMHPMYLLRIILVNNSWSQFIMFSLYSIVLLSVILLASYHIFRRCELK